MYLSGNTTLAELHKIQAICRDYFVVDGCDHDCPYCFFRVDGYVCKLGKDGESLLWDLPKVLEMED